MGAAVFLAAALVLGAPARAASVFTVADVPVDVTAESASKARAQAIAEGQATAFTALLQRLTLKADWSRLPAPDSVRLDSLVSGFAVSDEHASTARYLAKITYDFQAEEIRRLLRANNVPFSETRSKPVMVLPLLAAPDGSTLLWEPVNIWAAAWRGRSLNQLLVPLLVPAGDLEDVTALHGFSPRNPDWASVKALADRYGAGSVIAPLLTLRKTTAGVLGDLRLIEIRPEGVQETRRSVEGGNQDAAIDEAITSIAGGLQESWKTANAVLDGTANTLDADVSFSGLQQWLNLRRSLEQVPTVRAIHVIGFSVDGARVNLSYVGTAEQLSNGLAQRDLLLRQPAPGAWVIEPRGGQSVPTSVPPAPQPIGQGPASGGSASAPTKGPL